MYSNLHGIFFAPMLYLINVVEAIDAGTRKLSPIQDYDNSYRQANISDPFEHYWQIGEKI